MRAWVGPGLLNARIFSSSSEAAWPASRVENSSPSSSTGAAHALRKVSSAPGAPLRLGPRIARPGRVARSRIMRVAKIVVGEDVVAGAAQQFAQVGQHIGGLVYAQHGEAGRARCAPARLVAGKKRARHFLRISWMSNRVVRLVIFRTLWTTSGT